MDVDIAGVALAGLAGGALKHYGAPGVLPAQAGRVLGGLNGHLGPQRPPVEDAVQSQDGPVGNENAVPVPAAQLPGPDFKGLIAEGSDREHQQVAVLQDQLQLVRECGGGGRLHHQVRRRIELRVRRPEHRDAGGGGVDRRLVGKGVLNEADLAQVSVRHLFEQGAADLAAAQKSDLQSSALLIRGDSAPSPPWPAPWRSRRRRDPGRS